MNKKTKTILAVIVGISLIVVIWAGFSLLNNDETSSTAELIEVQSTSLQDSIEISGNIEPVNSADLAFPIGGYINSINVEEGDFIEEGTVVSTLEDSQQRYNIAQALIELDQERTSGTKRNLELLQLKLEMLQEDLENTRLRSNITGWVTLVNAEEGDYVRAQQAGSATDIVVRVISRSTMQATVEVDELDAPYLSPGQQVEFQFDAYPDLAVTGAVSSIPLEATQTSQGIAVLNVEVSIPEPPEEIIPNLTFSGEIHLKEQQNVLLIPKKALTTKENKSLVMKLVEAKSASGEQKLALSGIPEGMTLRPIPVSVKQYGTSQVQILKGLSAGDTVAIITTNSGDEESKDRNALELLGMPSGPGGGGGPPPGGGGGGPRGGGGGGGGGR